MPAPILFFDGVCGLCNNFVQFLFAVDKKALFQVATLQGVHARERLPTAMTEELSSLVVLTDDGKLLTKAQAVLFVFGRVGGLWRLLAALGKIVPTSLSNAVYNAVARSRYRIFGKLESCRLPTPEERARFID